MAALRERSYLPVGADGGQLRVWPGLRLTARPGRDGATEHGGKEEAQSGSCGKEES